MAVRKSKTAQRRERVSSSTQQRTIVLPLPLTREQYDPIRRSAEEYNRMWSSLISWCDSNKTVNRTRIQKENYRRLRDRHPTLPAQFACIAMRDAAGAMRSSTTAMTSIAACPCPVVPVNGCNRSPTFN